MDDNKEVASSIVFSSVYKVSEDMLGLVHKIVAEHTRYDVAFQRMAIALEDVNRNLKKHMINSKKFSKASKNKVSKKIDQTKNLATLCISYANRCKHIADEMIELTEGLEKDKKMRCIIDNLVKKLEDETKHLKESQDSDKPDEEPGIEGADTDPDSE